MKTVFIWGIKFNPVTKTQIAAYIDELLLSGHRRIHLTGVNPETVALSQKSDLLRQAINDSDVVNIDNMLITVLLRRIGIEVPERAATPDVFELLLQNANIRKQSVFFLGAKKGVLEKVVTEVRKRYPNIFISGYQDGYYKDESSVKDRIKSLRPDYLFIALPSPRKETFIMSNKNDLDVGVYYGVGGAFDVMAGAVPRKSIKLGRFELEGIFRVLNKPWNYGARVFKFYPRFLWMVLKNGKNYQVID